MSHALGKCLHQNGTISYFEYNGTCDVALRQTYDTPEELNANWRTGNSDKSCKCPTVSKWEAVELAVDYGKGFWWESVVCGECGRIVASRSIEDVMFCTDPNHDVDYGDGLPDWWNNDEEVK